MKAVQKVPLCSRGHGRQILQGISSQGSRPCMKRASTPGAHMDDAGESLQYIERITLRMKQQVRQAHPAYMGVRLVDNKEGKHNIYAKRYDDPSQCAKERNGGIHFWMWFHAD